MIGLTLLIFAPESPYYLIANRKMSDARKVIEMLNGGDESSINSIIKDIEKYVDRGKSSKNTKSFDISNSLQTNNILGSLEDCKVSENKEPGIVDDNENTKELKKCDPFLPESIECDESSCQSSSTMLKIVLIIAGLFLFTRLCGT